MGIGTGRIVRRGRGRPRKVVTEDPVSGASSSNPLVEDVNMEQISETQEQTNVSDFVNTSQPQNQMLDFSNWVGMISQVIMNLATGPSLQTRSLESEMLVERARKVGAQDFHGTPDPSVADDWFQKMEGVFEMIQCSDGEKLKVATFMLGGGARDW